MDDRKAGGAQGKNQRPKHPLTSFLGGWGQIRWLAFFKGLAISFFTSPFERMTRSKNPFPKRCFPATHQSLIIITALFLTNGLGRNHRKQNSILALGSRITPAVGIKQPGW